MPLILAVEPDHRQASQLRAMAKGRLGADIVLADSAAPALIALRGRVPDLILVPALLSPPDETAIGDYLRALDAASSHVQTLIIPVLAANRPRSRRGVLASLKRQQASMMEGCDPKEFAEQCATYLQRAAAERERRAEAEADAAAATALVEPVVESPVEPALEPPGETAEALVEFLGGPQAELIAEPLVVEPLSEPAVDVLAEPAFEARTEPAVEVLTEPAVEIVVEPVVELLSEPDVEVLVEPVVQAPPAAFAVDEPLEGAAELALDDDPPFEIVPPARKLEFIELDLSTLVEQLSGPNLAIPVEMPATVATAEDGAKPAPAKLAARETTPPVAPPVKHAAAAEKPAPKAPRRARVKWTPVYSPPGRSWPSMQGVAAEAESSSQPASSRATVPSAASPTPPPTAVQDEWGFFDPNRCGFTALLSKLDEITNADEAPGKQRT